MGTAGGHSMEYHETRVLGQSAMSPHLCRQGKKYCIYVQLPLFCPAPITPCVNISTVLSHVPRMYPVVVLLKYGDTSLMDSFHTCLGSMIHSATASDMLDTPVKASPTSLGNLTDGTDLPTISSAAVRGGDICRRIHYSA